jgi:ribosomal protein S18 acetylase RimI-like enzyme
MTFRARPAVPADVADISGVVRAAYAHYVPLMDREPAPMNADHLANVDAGNVTVVEDHGAIVAVLIAWPDGDSMYVDNMAVGPSAQGCGLGGAMLRLAADRGTAAGCTRLWLYTNAVMVDNVGFYERWGLHQYDRRNDQGFDRIFFERPLPADDWVGRGAELVSAASS